MLKIIARGIQFNARLNPAWLGQASAAGFIQEDPAHASLAALKGGKLVQTGSDGYLKLADGDTATNARFLIKDGSASFFENKPGLLGNVATTLGVCVVITDQIDPTLTYAPGDLLYAGSGAKAGLVVNVEPAAGPKKVIGIADSAASAASPELTVLVS